MPGLPRSARGAKRGMRSGTSTCMYMYSVYVELCTHAQCAHLPITCSNRRSLNHVSASVHTEK